MRLWGAVLAIALAAGDARAAELRIITPGVISNSGLSDVAAAFEKQSGDKVVILVTGMGAIMARIRNEPAEVVMLPMDLMGTATLTGLAHDFAPLGRVEIGLFKKPQAPMRDISTVEKLAAAMRTAAAVFYTDPATGSMQAGMSGRMLALPDFAGVKGVPVKGDAEPALKRGDGDASAMGLGLIHGPHDPDNAPTANPYLIGMLPAGLGMHMDMAAAISTRAADAKAAARFIAFARSPAMRALWQAGGVDRYQEDQQ